MFREINLLPPTRRRFLARQRIIQAISRVLRSFIIGLVILSLCGGVSTALLRWLTATASQSTTEKLDQSVQEYRRIRDEIGEDNKLIEAAHALDRQQVVWSEYLSELLGLIPPGVTVTQIKGDADGERQLSFQGQAVSRSTLVVLQKRLQELSWVVDVRAPHTNLLQREHSEYFFELSLAGDPQQEVHNKRDTK